MASSDWLPADTIGMQPRPGRRGGGWRSAMRAAKPLETECGDMGLAL